MQILRVNDWNIRAATSSPIDVMICVSGYERRSTYLYSMLRGAQVRKTVVLGASVGVDHEWRSESDDYFSAEGESVAIIADGEEVDIFGILRAAIPTFDHVRVLVDYSSMPRKWLNAVINYFKFCDVHQDAEVFFSYTPGRHVSRDVVPAYPDSDYQVASVESLTTLEGAAVRQRRTLAVVGLGFEWIAPFAACELIEPDEVRCFYGEPGSVPDYGAKALELNSRFLSEFCRDEAPLGLAVRSVESVYRSLGELAAPALLDRNVSLIPLGPKTHILGCILIANRLRELTCIYVKGGREHPQQVEVVDGAQVVVTRVQLAADGAVAALVDEDALLQLRESES